MDRKRLIILSMFLSAICPSSWGQIDSSNKNYSMHKENRKKCWDESYRYYPVVNRVEHKTVNKQVEQKCEKFDMCGVDKTYKKNVPVIEGHMVDINANNRNQFYLACLDYVR